ncbi:MAG: N-acetylmuramic acid 6-phosphate etherase [Candidatus Eremiobacteraeota bacterium]|nr:N-acetylmuramic acid 6-phosphate etherase [Candidatus Eremiobacteraeota bacterium]
MSEPLPPTETVDEATRGLDRLSTPELVATLTRAQSRALAAVEAATPQIARAVDEIAKRLEAGGTLHYVGAGTSGRLGALDAAEAPPTFGTPPSLVRAHIAGGPQAFSTAVEGAEDDRIAAAHDLAAHLRHGDVVVGISASGGPPYVVAALELARAAGAFAIAVTSVPESPLSRAAHLTILLETGPEPLAGSTRLVAGTAQKLVLNALSTATMVRLGKVYDNLMVDLIATNEKLRRRALRLVKELTGAPESAARDALASAGGSVKVAVVMLRQGLDARKAADALAAHGGSLRAALEA